MSYMDVMYGNLGQVNNQFQANLAQNQAGMAYNAQLQAQQQAISQQSQQQLNQIFQNFGQQTDYYSALGAAYGRGTGYYGDTSGLPPGQAPSPAGTPFNPNTPSNVFDTGTTSFNNYGFSGQPSVFDTGTVPFNNYGYHDPLSSAGTPWVFDASGNPTAIPKDVVDYNNQFQQKYADYNNQFQQQYAGYNNQYLQQYNAYNTQYQQTATAAQQAYNTQYQQQAQASLDAYNQQVTAAQQRAVDLMNSVSRGNPGALNQAQLQASYGYGSAAVPALPAWVAPTYSWSAPDYNAPTYNAPAYNAPAYTPPGWELPGMQPGPQQSWLPSGDPNSRFYTQLFGFGSGAGSGGGVGGTSSYPYQPPPQQDLGALSSGLPPDFNLGGYQPQTTLGEGMGALTSEQGLTTTPPGGLGFGTAFNPNEYSPPSADLYPAYFSWLLGDPAERYSQQYGGSSSREKSAPYPPDQASLASGIGDLLQGGAPMQPTSPVEQALMGYGAAARSGGYDPYFGSVGGEGGTGAPPAPDINQTFNAVSGQPYGPGYFDNTFGAANTQPQGSPNELTTYAPPSAFAERFNAVADTGVPALDAISRAMGPQSFTGEAPSYMQFDGSPVTGDSGFRGGEASNIDAGEPGAYEVARAPYAAQLASDPVKAFDMATRLYLENRNNSQTRQGVAEAWLNRQAALGLDTLPTSFFPQTTKYRNDYANAQQMLRNNLPLLLQIYGEMGKAIGGSNISQGSTDWASGTTATQQAPYSTSTWTSPGPDPEQFFRNDLNIPGLYNVGPGTAQQVQDWWSLMQNWPGSP